MNLSEAHSHPTNSADSVVVLGVGGQNKSDGKEEGDLSYISRGWRSKSDEAGRPRKGHLSTKTTSRSADVTDRIRCRESGTNYYLVKICRKRQFPEVEGLPEEQGPHEATKRHVQRSRYHFCPGDTEHDVRRAFNAILSGHLEMRGRWHESYLHIISKSHTDTDMMTLKEINW